jgi:hypothetical protein
MKAKIIVSARFIAFCTGISLICLSPIKTCADQLTNHVFLTEPYDVSSDPYVDSAKSVEEFREIIKKQPDSKYRDEVLPSADDPQGNWGAITNGIQLSIRFYQTNFTNGGPVFAVILWRNAGETSHGLDIARAVERYPFDLSLSHDGKPEKALVSRFDPDWRDHSFGGPSARPIKPQTQIRFVLELDKIFDLREPGLYEITAERDKARSGVAAFRMFPGSGVQTNTVTSGKSD